MIMLEDRAFPFDSGEWPGAQAWLEAGPRGLTQYMYLEKACFESEHALELVRLVAGLSIVTAQNMLENEVHKHRLAQLAVSA